MRQTADRASRVVCEPSSLHLLPAILSKWRRPLTQTFRNIVVLVFLLCLVKSAEAQTPNLSPDDTVAYINGTLHKYPTLEFVDHGCPGYEQSVAISEDRRSLLITQNLGHSVVGTCGDIQTLTVPIFSLDREGFGSWSKVAQHSAFALACINGVDCFSRRSSAQLFPRAANRWHLRITAPDQVSNELTRQFNIFWIRS